MACNTVTACSYLSRERAAGSILGCFFPLFLFLATADIVKKLNQSKRAKNQNLTAHLLELTNCIRAENIPPNIPSDYISMYFENKKNGGAQVADVLQLHNEDAAIITFKDHQGNAELCSLYFFVVLSLKDPRSGFLK